MRGASGIYDLPGNFFKQYFCYSAGVALGVGDCLGLAMGTRVSERETERAIAYFLPQSISQLVKPRSQSKLNIQSSSRG